MTAYKSGGKVSLISRNGRDHTQRFAGIAEAIRLIPESTLTLDGEVAIYDQRLVSRFEWMRHHAPPELATPPLFMAFDCLCIERKDLRPNPLYVRRNILEELLYKQDQVLPVRRLADDGLKAWQQVLDGGWEGYVAKDPQSPYVGGRTLLEQSRRSPFGSQPREQAARTVDVGPKTRQLVTRLALLRQWS